MLPSACNLGQHFQDLGHSFHYTDLPARKERLSTTTGYGLGLLKEVIWLSNTCLVPMQRVVFASRTLDLRAFSVFGNFFIISNNLFRFDQYYFFPFGQLFAF